MLVFVCVNIHDDALTGAGDPFLSISRGSTAEEPCTTGPIHGRTAVARSGELAAQRINFFRFHETSGLHDMAAGAEQRAKHRSFLPINMHWLTQPSNRKTLIHGDCPLHLQLTTIVIASMSHCACEVSHG